MDALNQLVEHYLHENDKTTDNVEVVNLDDEADDEFTELSEIDPATLLLNPALKPTTSRIRQFSEPLTAVPGSSGTGSVPSVVYIPKNHKDVYSNARQVICLKEKKQESYFRMRIVNGFQNGTIPVLPAKIPEKEKQRRAKKPNKFLSTSASALMTVQRAVSVEASKPSLVTIKKPEKPSRRRTDLCITSSNNRSRAVSVESKFPNQIEEQNPTISHENLDPDDVEIISSSFTSNRKNKSKSPSELLVNEENSPSTSDNDLTEINHSIFDNSRILIGKLPQPLDIEPIKAKFIPPEVLEWIQKRKKMLPTVLQSLPRLTHVIATETCLDIPDVPIYQKKPVAGVHKKAPLIKRRLPKYSIENDKFEEVFPDPVTFHFMANPYKIGQLHNLPEDEELNPDIETIPFATFVEDLKSNRPKPGPSNDEFEVEKVLLKNVFIDKMPQYLLKWAGYGFDELTWENEHQMGCPELVKEFLHRRSVSTKIYNSFPLSEKEHYSGFLTKYLNGMTDSITMDCYILEAALDEFNKKNHFGKLVVENWTSEPELPLIWQPIPKCVTSSAARRELLKTKEKKCCQCANCAVSTCDCMTVRIQHGYIHANVNVITECTEKCDCKTCPPKAFTRGRQEDLILFKGHKSGWGLRTLKDIREGRFVVEYVGVVKTPEECKDLSDMTYLFDLDFPGHANYIIDASEYGNEARFINHSCEPNLAVVMCFGATGDPNMYKVYFFASRDIAAGEELTFNYFGPRKCPEDVPPHAPKCHCGFKDCRQYLY